MIRKEIAKVRLLAEQYNIDHNKFVIFIHCREPEEIQRFVEEYDAITVLIRRFEVENLEQSNHADSEIFDYEYDAEVMNNGTLDELREAAKTFLRYF
jgi:hypothetical protein